MKFHTQNPWTRKPSVMVNLTEDEARAVAHAIGYLASLNTQGNLVIDKVQAVTELQLLLLEALSTPKPHGLGGPGRY